MVTIFWGRCGGGVTHSPRSPVGGCVGVHTSHSIFFFGGGGHFLGKLLSQVTRNKRPSHAKLGGSGMDGHDFLGVCGHDFFGESVQVVVDVTPSTRSPRADGQSSYPLTQSVWGGGTKPLRQE